MCGIMGFTRFTPTTAKMAPVLAWALADRGLDAYGMTNGKEVLRFSGPQIINYQEPPEHWMGGVVAFHNRGASFRENASQVDCAHPYTFHKADGSSIVGLHNGVIRNHKELNEKHNRNFPVDSMHLFAHLAEDKSWLELEGWGNIVWFETRNGERRVYFTRIHDNSFNLATLMDGTLVWSSTLPSLRWAGLMYNNPIKTLWKMEEFQVYSFHEEDGMDILVEDSRTMKFGPVATGHSDKRCPAGAYPGYSSYLALGASVADGDKSYCKVCYRDLVNPKNALLCAGCFHAKIEDWIAARVDMHGEGRNEKKSLIILPNDGNNINDPFYVGGQDSWVS